MKDLAFIVCGALAREVLALNEVHSWGADVFGLPVLLHNNPDRIPPAVQARIEQIRSGYKQIIVVYGDCGTSGVLDRMLIDQGIQRVAGPHCYEMYANGSFQEIMEEQPGTFFLTDYLVGSFDHLVLEGLGIAKNPQLREDYFHNYTQVVYLAQRDDPSLERKARLAADSLGLPLEIRHTGYGLLEQRLLKMIDNSLEINHQPDGQ
jgi:hypothetical protein